MNRRQFLTSVAGVAATGLAGCTQRRSGGSNSPRSDTSTPSTSPSQTPTPAPSWPVTLAAGEVTLALSRPRVRASIREAGTHVDVRVEPDTQFLVFDAESEGGDLDEMPVSLAADGETVARGVSYVGRPESRRLAPVALPVPVAARESAAVVLEAGGETDRTPLPGEVVANLGVAPAFRVESLSVPERVDHGTDFEASFTVSNRGARDARFLAEFGHGLISDTGEVEMRVPVGERRTHSKRIEPPYGSDPDVIPVILDWGRARRRVEVLVDPRPSATATPR